METILKYNNRKLYSKSLKRYVTQEYIIDLVKTNGKFVVKRHKKGVAIDSLEDITAKVLAEAVTIVKPSVEKLKELIRG